MITTFKKIRDGINYRTHCPFCKEELFINERDASIVYKNKQPLLKFNLMGDDNLLINLVTEEVFTELRQNISSYGYFNYGVNYHGINIECNNVDCGLYDFTLQIQTNIDKCKINYIILNSERVAIEDDSGILHEIKNIYVNDITEHSYHRESESKTQNLPIIPIDFDNPLKTIQRIKKLIIFS